MKKIRWIGIAGLALTISASAVKADKTDRPGDVQIIDHIWMVTFTGDGGVETVAQAKVASGEYVPLIAADNQRLQSIVSVARELAKAKHIQMCVVSFSTRAVLEEINP